MHTKQQKKHRALRWIAAAACLLIVLGSVTAYAEVRKMEAKRIRTVTESGFTLRVDLEKVKQKKLTGLADIPEKIAEQIANYKPQPSYSSLYIDPCSVFETYDSIEAAIERIGYDKLCVPVIPKCTSYRSGLDGVYYPGMKKYDGSQAILTIRGDRENRILSATITLDDVAANEGHINLQAMIYILTENYEEQELKVTSMWPVEYGWNTDIEQRTTQNGLEFELVTVYGVDKDRRVGLDGYVSNGSVLYTLHLSYEIEQARAMEIMLAWADSIR